MNKKTYIILLLILAMLITSTVNVSAYNGTLTITDQTGDIEKTDAGGNVTSNNTYPDIDLKSLSFQQNEKNVDLTMKLAEGGKFQEDLNTYYLIILLTTSADREYQIYYTGASEITGNASSPIMIIYGDAAGDMINVTKYTGKGTDTLKFSFDLIDKNERLLTAWVINAKEAGGNEYSDVYPQNIQDFQNISDVLNFEINAGGPYEVKAGQNLKLNGTVASGEINAGYDWFWTFDNSSITLEGQNPSYIFKTPDTYTGTLYAYDGKGNWSLDSFQINVTGTSTNPNGTNTNNQPGFELILVITAIAITLLIFRKKKK